MNTGTAGASIRCSPRSRPPRVSRPRRSRIVVFGAGFW
jgi:hypothetical protein